MVLVAVETGSEELESFGGVVHLAADPDRERAEYAILVRSDLKGQGLGTALTHAIIDYARTQGMAELTATVLRENRMMLELAEQQGFTPAREAVDPCTVELRLRLREKAG
jgi:acetyltransferase